MRKIPMPAISRLGRKVFGQRPIDLRQMKDRVITCIQCEGSFVFTRAEQERFRARGFDEPKRCPECRKKKSRGLEMNETWKDRGKQKKHNWQRYDSESDEM